MSAQVLSTTRLKDGRNAQFTYVVANDAPAVLQYIEAVAAESDFLTFEPGELGLTLEQEIAHIESLADRTKGLLLKATVDDALVGTVVALRSIRSRIRHVADLGLSVRREFWGSGIGRALCRTLFAEAEQIGIERIALRVRADNDRAIRLYESLGFAHEGRLIDAFRVASVSFDELVMGLRI